MATDSALGVALPVAAILVLPVIALAVILVAALSRLKKRRAQEVVTTLGGDHLVLIEPAANFFGQESLGMGQIRGQGCLAFSADAVFFLMWLPKRQFRVPIASIRSIDTPRSHLGKSKLSRLLKITFVDPHGGEDSMAWLIRDLAKAKAALERLCAAQH